jgi:hypothetical protein
VAGDLGCSRRLAHKPARDLRERRLARAVRAKQPDDLALADLQVDAAECVFRAVALL